jgi:translocation and assembly module TamB
MKRRWKSSAKWQAFIGVLLLVAAIWAGLYFSSDRFQDRVRRRVVSTLEDVTGGRVELESFTWNLSRLEFEAHNLTIHGLEPEGEQPYAHIDRLLARMKILSLFDREIGIRYLAAEGPAIHIIVFPDGTTNQPTPKMKRESSDKSPVDTLFSLAIDQVKVTGG